MDHILLAAEILQKAETDLRDIVAKAAAAGDYNGIVQIALWAKALCDLLETKPEARDSAPHFAFSTGHAAVVARVKNGKTLPKKKHTNEYPRFFRKGNELVRVAWSKRAKSEYQHKTSETVLKTVTDTLSRLGKEGRIFSTDEVLPLKDPQGTEIPAYQAYVVIALLKVTGLIEPHGRQGYSISAADDLNNAVDAIWHKLPSK